MSSIWVRGSVWAGLLSLWEPARVFLVTRTFLWGEVIRASVLPREIRHCGTNDVNKAAVCLCVGMWRQAAADSVLEMKVSHPGSAQSRHEALVLGSPPAVPPQIRPRSKACDLSCYADTHDINATAKTAESQCYYNNDKWFQSYIILFYYGDSHVYYQGYLMHALVQLKSGKLLNSFCCFKEICFDSWQCSLCWVWIYIPYVKAFNSCFYTILWLVG